MVNAIITKTTGKDKVVDFRDGLVPALVEDYAMLHGAGGKDHAPTSVIKVMLCDYSAGKGEKSHTVSANISPDLCEQLLEVCKQNIGVYAIDGKFSFFEEQRVVNQKLKKSADMCFGVLQSAVAALGRYVKASEEGNPPGASKVAQLLQQLFGKTMEKTMAADELPKAPSFLSMPRRLDYNYSQDRVHNYGNSDFAPVQRLLIYHAAYRKDGAVSNYPWTIKVTNGVAKVKVQATGATTFDASTLKNVKEAFIQVSDADMFRMMNRISHFVSVWETVVAAPIIQQGMAVREKERQEFLANASAAQGD